MLNWFPPLLMFCYTGLPHSSARVPLLEWNGSKGYLASKSSGTRVSLLLVFHWIVCVFYSLVINHRRDIVRSLLCLSLYLARHPLVYVKLFNNSLSYGNVFRHMTCKGTDCVMHQDGVFLIQYVLYGFSFCFSWKVWRYSIDPQWWRSHPTLLWKIFPRSIVLKLWTPTYGMWVWILILWLSDFVDLDFDDEDVLCVDETVVLKQATATCSSLRTMFTQGPCSLVCMQCHFMFGGWRNMLL